MNNLTKHIYESHKYIYIYIYESHKTYIYESHKIYIHERFHNISLSS